MAHGHNYRYIGLENTTIFQKRCDRLRLQSRRKISFRNGKVEGLPEGEPKTRKPKGQGLRNSRKSCKILEVPEKLIKTRKILE